MTQAARQVLADCEEALQMLQEEPTGARWRVTWFGVVGLLRTVGHVLDKVDGKSGDAALRQAIKELYRETGSEEKKKPGFWGFIENERNAVLKAYQFGAGVGVTVYAGPKPRAEYHYPMNAGPFAGQDQRKVVADAIAWWRTYLDRVDKRAAELRAAARP